MVIVFGRIVGCSSLVSGRAPDCSVRTQVWTSPQSCVCHDCHCDMHFYTALGTSCTPLLQYLGWLSFPPFIAQWNEYQLLGWVLGNTNKWRWWMWMVAATGRLTARVVWLGVRVGCHLELSLHFSNELGDISQWLLALSQHNSTKKVIVGISIIDAARIVCIAGGLCNGQVSVRVSVCPIDRQQQQRPVGLVLSCWESMEEAEHRLVIFIIIA